MNIKTVLLLAGCYLLGMVTASHAAILGEYRVDGYTKHLWHFNEVAGSSNVVDSVSIAPLNLTVTGATLEQPSAPGFGSALLTGEGAYLDGGIQPISSFTWSDGTGTWSDGDFTFEAVIRPDINPLSPSNYMCIIDGDNTGGLDVRSWQLRISTVGNLEFILLNGGVQTLAAPLPSSGPDTALAGQWYHVAVTYNGQEGEDGNLKMYWTLLDESREEASLLAEFNMQADLGGSPHFVIGGNGRNASGYGFHGLVDEVRISSIERYPNEMQFVSRSHVNPYSPDAYTLHLWHFDDPADGTTITDEGFFTSMPLSLGGTGTLGHPSYEGFGNALQSGADAYATAEYQPISEFTGLDGAFTFEAIIRPSVNPLAPPNYMNIIDGDRDGDLDVRSFQFRIETTGQLNFILVGGGVQHCIAPLPDSGPNAAMANQWYHVAVTYNGQANTEGNLKTYWTLIDKGKTEANLIGEFNMQSDLVGEPRFVIGSCGRNTANYGFQGLIDEVRISSIDRYTDDMLFTDAGSSKEPSFYIEPEDTLVGYGQTLKLQVLVSGAQPMSYQWMFKGEDLPGQTDETLLIHNMTYEQAGEYSVVATNDHGTAISKPANITIGAVFSELFNTGTDIDPNTGLVDLLPGLSEDPHYELIDCNDPDHLTTDVLVWTDTDAPFPSYVENGPISKWISPTSNRSNPTGRYVYRTTFLLDSTDPNTAILEGQWSWNGKAEILLNGQSTDISGEHYQGWRKYWPIMIDEGLQAGINTLEFVIDVNETHTPVCPTLRVELKGIGLCVPEGAPQIVTSPTVQTVCQGGKTNLSVVALGRAPLSYQWLKDGQDIAGATDRILVLDPVATTVAGSYAVRVTNPDGETTSQNALLTVVNDNQNPLAATISLNTLQDQSLNVSVLPLIVACSDPDGDTLFLFEVDNTSQEGGSIVDPGGAYFTYTPPVGFTGTDQIGYTIKDEFFGQSDGIIEVMVTAEN